MIFSIIAFFVLAITLYIALSYRSWELKKGLATIKAIEELHAMELLKMVTQRTGDVAKVGAHYTVFFLIKVWLLTSKEVKTWIFKAFPRMKHLFEEKDKLTGLYHGPASFFLANVSEYKENTKEKKKRVQ